MKEILAALSLYKMQRNLRLPLDALREEQRRGLGEALNHAYSTTPYYRNLFRSAGVHPAGISGRRMDYLLRATGEKVSPYLIVMGLSEAPGLKNYKVTQTSRPEALAQFARHPAATDDPSLKIVRTLQ